MIQKTLGLAALCLWAFFLSGCNLGDPAVFDPKSIEAIQQEQARPDVMPHMPRLPDTRPNAPLLATTTRPSLLLAHERQTVRLSLKQVIHRAAVNNLEVRVAGFQPAIDEQRVLEAEAKVDPRIFSSFQAQQQHPQGVISNQLTPPRVFDYVFAAGFRQDTSTGAQVEARVQSTDQRFRTLSGFSTAFTEGRSWDQQAVLQITQPFLKDFGGVVNRARIVLARNDQKISQLDFRDKMEQLLANVEKTYWDLVAAEESFKIQTYLVQYAEATLDILIKRLGNDVSQVEVSQANVAVQQRALTRQKFEGQIWNLSVKLKGLMNDPDYPPAGAVFVLPDELPADEPVKVSFRDQIVTALNNRFELPQQELRIDSARVIIKAADNNALPKFDVSASIGYEGIGFNLSDSFKSVEDGHLVNWQVGFQFEIPIGNRGALAIAERSRNQYAQAAEEWKNQADKIATDVQVACTDLETAWATAIMSRNFVSASKDQLDNIEKKEQNGQQLTFDFVQLKLNAQVTLAEAHISEIQALTDYSTALANLEKAKGTILQYNGIDFAEESMRRPK